MTPVTHVSDVAAALGRPIDYPEARQVQSWIERVEGRIRGRIPDLGERLTSPEFEATLRGVVVDVVVRKVENPTGMRSERIDDYYYDRGATKADLWPTEDEWRELLPESMSGAFSTRPGFEPDRCGPGVWL